MFTNTVDRHVYRKRMAVSATVAISWALANGLNFYPFGYLSREVKLVAIGTRRRQLVLLVPSGRIYTNEPVVDPGPNH